ncbi:MAG: tandem-95 repeat protein [Schlesneria sp.]|nr:tandem-95 repeat protein [Schlesneria sp.]
MTANSSEGANADHHLDEQFVDGTLDHLTEWTQRSGAGSSSNLSDFVYEVNGNHIESVQQTSQATTLYPSATSRVYDVHAAYGSAARQGLTVFTGYLRDTARGYQSTYTDDTHYNTDKTYEDIWVSSAGDNSVHQTRSYGWSNSRTTTSHDPYGYGDSSYTENSSYEEGPLSYDYQVGPDQIVNLLLTPLSANYREVAQGVTPPLTGPVPQVVGEAVAYLGQGVVIGELKEPTEEPASAWTPENGTPTRVTTPIIDGNPNLTTLEYVPERDGSPENDLVYRGGGGIQLLGTPTSGTGTGDNSADPENWSIAKKQQFWDLQQRRHIAVGGLLAETQKLAAYNSSWASWNPFSSGTQPIQERIAALKAEIEAIDQEYVQLLGIDPADPLLVAGDAALQWSYGYKFYKSLEYAYQNGLFSGELQTQVKDLLETLQDPQALSQFILMMGGLMVAKKAACKAGLSPVVAALFTAKEAADVALTLSAVKSELDGITFEKEVSNAAPHMVSLVTEMAKQIAMAELIKLLKCFPAGTQVVVAQTSEPGGPIRYQKVAIETLKKGDLVLAREEFGSIVKLQQIEETFQRVSDHLRVLTFTDSSGATHTLKTTDEHPFWIGGQNRFVNASELELGDAVVGPLEEMQVLTGSSREMHLFGIPVYNFRVAEFHTYFVSATADFSPLLVHNATYVDGKADPGTTRRAPPAPDNYRGRLNAERAAQGKPRLPEDYDSHHRIPQEYMDHPDFKDFDFHQPSNQQGVRGSRPNAGTGIVTNTHQLITNEWAEFRRLNPNATRAQIEAFAKQIDAQYAQHWFQ